GGACAWWQGSFLIDRQPATPVRPKRAAAEKPTRSASGSTRVEGLRARVARAGRIWVGGVHDAALVERAWGHDLRVEGVVVEHLDGLDNLAGRLAEFAPGPGRRVGVLVDHLVTGSKETHLTTGLGPHVLVTGHPFVDVWQAVRPAALGIEAWPRVPRGEDWKSGVCARLGWGMPRDGWRRVYSSVTSFRDLESPLHGAVERLIDFVTEPADTTQSPHSAGARAPTALCSMIMCSPSATLTVWAGSWLAGNSAPDDVLGALHAWAPRHTIAAGDPLTGGRSDLPWSYRGEPTGSAVMPLLK